MPESPTAQGTVGLRTGCPEVALCWSSWLSRQWLFCLTIPWGPPYNAFWGCTSSSHWGQVCSCCFPPEEKKNEFSFKGGVGWGRGAVRHRTEKQTKKSMRNQEGNSTVRLIRSEYCKGRQHYLCPFFPFLRQEKDWIKFLVMSPWAKMNLWNRISLDSDPAIDLKLLTSKVSPRNPTQPSPSFLAPSGTCVCTHTHEDTGMRKPL